MKVKPIIHRVDRDKFPDSTKDIKNLHGFQRKGHIYVLRGKDNDDVLYHEIYHYIKNHSVHPKNPNVYIRQELDADLYSMEKTGKRQHIKPELRAVGNDVSRDYQLPMSKVIRMVSSELRKKDIPRTWKKDWNHVLKKDIYKGKKFPKGVGIQITRGVK
jgi:hypothetical protein